MDLPEPPEAPESEEQLRVALHLLSARLSDQDLVIDHRRAVHDLSSRLAELSARPPGPGPSPQVPGIRRRIDLALRATGDEERRAALARLLRIDPDTVRPRRILWFEPGPPDRVAELIGEIESATNLAVLVPDSSADLLAFDAAVVEPARRLAAALRQARGPRVAVVAWLGYAPSDLGVIDLTSDNAAEPAGRLLAAWLEGLPLVARQRRFLVGQGFGDLVIEAALAVGAVAEPAPERW